MWEVLVRLICVRVCFCAYYLISLISRTEVLYFQIFTSILIWIAQVNLKNSNQIKNSDYLNVFSVHAFRASPISDYFLVTLLILSKHFLTWNGRTGWERITSILFKTPTDRLMIANGTCSIAAASAWAWISATFIYASQSTRTFWIGRTLWSTIWSATDIVWYTWANSRFTNDTALGIWSAWWWYTRFSWNDVWTSYWWENNSR